MRILGEIGFSPRKTSQEGTERPPRHQGDPLAGLINLGLFLDDLRDLHAREALVSTGTRRLERGNRRAWEERRCPYLKAICICFYIVSCTYHTKTYLNENETCKLNTILINNLTANNYTYDHVSQVERLQAKTH